MDTQKNPAPAGGNAGFTLLELMVAFAIVALMVLLLGGGIRFGAKVWEVSRAQVEATSEVLVVRSFVRERALAARPATLAYGAGDEATLAFKGQVGLLRLVTLMPSYAAQGGLYQAELAETPGPSGVALELRWWPLGAEMSSEASHRRVLLEGIAALRIGYFGDPEDRGNPSWHDFWPGGVTLPRLLSIKISFPPDDPRVWPELIISLPVSRPPGHVREND